MNKLEHAKMFNFTWIVSQVTYPTFGLGYKKGLVATPIATVDIFLYRN